MIKKFLLNTLLLMVAISFAQAQHAPVFLENFSTATVATNLTSFNSWSQCSTGTGQLLIDGGNYEFPSTTINPTYDPDPITPNFQNSANCLYFDSTYAGTAFGGYCNTFTPMSHGRVYMAFIYQGGPDHRVNTAGDYFITMGAGASSNAARVLVRYSNNLVQFGTRKGTGTDTWSTNNYYDDSTHLLVLVYEFNPGTNDDKVMLYVDPKIPGPEPMTPTVMGVTADPDFTSPISNIFIRLNMSVANAPCAYIDNIMIDSSWANVGGMPPCNASFTATTSALTATFTNTSTGGFQSILFDYGDGSAPSSNGTYTYAAAGTYNVCLTTFTDPGANNPCDTICHSVTVTSSGINDVHHNFNASIVYTNSKPTLVLQTANNLSAKITLVNMLGQTIETIYSGNLTAGEHKYESTTTMPGMYFYQINSDKGTKTLKAFIKD
jgi:PKD repeat protein